MARRTRRPQATAEKTLDVVTTSCPGCGRRTTIDYYNHRTLTTLSGVVHFRLQIRRCHHYDCPLYRRAFRPEAEGRLALPKHEFGLDVLALVGALRYTEHKSVPEIHQALGKRGVVVAQRSVTNLLDRYDELRALSVADLGRLAPILKKQGRLILAIDGLQPDVGHEVLWVIRDCLSGEILLARSLLSSAAADLAGLLGEVKTRLEEMAVPVEGVVSDGQHSIRNAVAKALPSVPHQLCQFHFLREAALPIYEADRHAKKELKKRVRGIRKIERKVEGRRDGLAEIIRGYCAAVRSALTDDGRPPLDSAGLKTARAAECRTVEPGPAEPTGRFAPRTAQAEANPAARLGPDGVTLAGGRRGVQVGLSGSEVAGEPTPTTRQDGEAARGRGGRRNEAPGGAMPATRATRSGQGVAALCQGVRQLRTRTVSLLRCLGLAQNEQRVGATLRQPPLPREARQRPEGGLAGFGGARQRASGGGGGDTSGDRQWRGVGAAPDRGLAPTARRTGPPPPGSRPPAPLPPRSASLSH